MMVPGIYVYIINRTRGKGLIFRCNMVLVQMIFKITNKNFRRAWRYRLDSNPVPGNGRNNSFLNYLHSLWPGERGRGGGGLI